MDKRFKLISRICAVVVFIVSAITYLSTIEPTASFWDCGEFIASSFKLEVGHPPGNPVFQIIARLFTMFGNENSAAMLVNAMSAICSALTILFLYLSIVHLARRITEKQSKEISLSSIILICVSGLVGSLAYCWSDTFWFSAVEGEVYAMSSLATAVVFWAMLKWEEQSDQPYANRWLIFIMFLMGLSIGIHLLNLLAIPALALIYYFKKYKGSITYWGIIKAFLISCVILAVILWLIIPYVPLFAAYVDLFFVNTLGLPINSGAAVFVLALITGCFVGVYITYKKGNVLRNTIWLSLGCILIGYTLFVPVVMRSAVNTPTNEYQPDNPFTLVRYLGREQYGSAPLLYGQTFNTKYVDIKTPSYYNIMKQEDGSFRYEKLNKPAEPVYDSSTKVFFPRMYSSSGDYVNFYSMYTSGDPTNENYIPSFADNLKYFFGYQCNFMYWRYFMWNFVGRQNDLHSSVPGDIHKGNWESGIGFIDKLHLGDQSEGPDYVVNSKAKNHYYFLPLILGILGLFYQLQKDKKNFLVVLLFFFMTGIAVVIYLNQTPYQPRERDYAYAGSFYAFAIWIGLAVLMIGQLFDKLIKNKNISSVVAGTIALLVPIQMVSQTWDDHDRSNRFTAEDMAYNILVGLGDNAIVVTHGDNDTFPLWYIQEVEGVRTDVRVVNTSLLSIDWYIDQMKIKQYESEPLPISLSKRDYYYGNNDFIPVSNDLTNPTPAKDLIYYFSRPDLKVTLGDGLKHGCIFSHKIQIPVNKENVKKYKIVEEKDYDKIQDTIVLEIPQNVTSISKTDLIILDILANYEWDRPIYFLQRGGDVNIGEKKFLQYNGIAFKLLPFESEVGTDQYNNIENWQYSSDELYDLVMNKYRLESLSNDMYVDYQNILTFSSLVPMREIMVNTAKALVLESKKDKAIEVLDRMQKMIPQSNFPLNVSLISSTNDLAILDAIEIYLQCGEKEKAVELGNKFTEETVQHIKLCSKQFGGDIADFDNVRKNIYYLMMLSESYEKNGAPAEAAHTQEISDTFIKMWQ